ncbi:Integral membrane protein [Pleurostoma richardsiae]|uniref:Integral membrane protein n=1 Tax=Pleurostoma richardsiae TaxID=41990 RepID=A0AA38R961_9PEZI|nr:Integral membrane protein [Pleurostoma richardsiae]
MANFGRFVCVLVPFALTLGSLIAMLVAGLAGVADKNLYMFRVNTTGLSISTDSLTSLIDSRSAAPDTGFKFHDASFLTKAQTDSSTSSSTNVTAADLSLGKLYDITLWGYCETPQSGSRNCTKPKFNWASDVLNKTETSFDSIATAAGASITLPSDITDALKVFAKITKWTEVVFIIAVVALAVELFFGIFANCSRGVSCITFIIAGVASVAVVAAASLSTAMAVVVVGAVESTAKWYGVKAHFNTNFLAAVWIGAAFAIAAGFFWLFTICCCAPDHSSRRSGGRKRHLDDDAGEKLMPIGAYQPLSEPAGYHNQQGNQYGNQYGAPRYPTGAARSDLAYEPYAHARV